MIILVTMSSMFLSYVYGMVPDDGIVYNDYEKELDGLSRSLNPKKRELFSGRIIKVVDSDGDMKKMIYIGQTDHEDTRKVKRVRRSHISVLYDERITYGIPILPQKVDVTLTNFFDDMNAEDTQEQIIVNKNNGELENADEMLAGLMAKIYITEPKTANNSKLPDRELKCNA
jgi:hypothetical protein